MFFGKTGFINGVKAVLQSERGFKESSNWKELLKRVESTQILETKFIYFIIIIFIIYIFFKIFDVKDFKSRDFETLLVF